MLRRFSNRGGVSSTNEMNEELAPVKRKAKRRDSLDGLPPRMSGEPARLVANPGRNSFLQPQDDSEGTEDESPAPSIGETPDMADSETGVSNEWHETIEAKQWDKLEKMVKKYDPNFYRKKMEQFQRQQEKEEEERRQKEKEAEEAAAKAEAEKNAKDEKSQKGLRIRTLKIPMSPLSSARNINLMKYLPGNGRIEKEIVSPLLEKNEQGRMPFHLACICDCPDKLLLELLSLERKAAHAADRDGKYAMHLAVSAERYNHLLEKIIRAHPLALKKKDSSGRTPLGLAVELARLKQQESYPEDPEDMYRWGEPVSKAEEEWQFSQEKLWTKVDFLLKQFTKREKSVIPSEHGLIIEALESGAPPKVIERFVSTSTKYLEVDDELGGSSIRLCVDRQYPLSTLRSIVEACREKTTVITDAAQKALVAQYREGCYVHVPDTPPFGKEMITWSRNKKESGNVDDDPDDPMKGLSVPCQEWWEKLQFLLFYCAYGKKYEENASIGENNMLHAALATPASPPSLIQLLMILYPKSRTEVCPFFKALPIHLACTRWKYDLIRTEDDCSMNRMLKQLISADPDMIWVRYRDRLPLHMALASGLSWFFVKPLIRGNLNTVGMRDPLLKMFPFQLAAIKPSSKVGAFILRSQYIPAEWRELSVEEKKKEFKRIETLQDCKQVQTIYELVKLHPDAISGKYLTVTPTKSLNLEGVGPVALHYLTWCYAQGQDGWQIRPENLKVLRDAVMEAYVSKPLERWWEKLKSLIRETFPGEKGSIPDGDEYLLHLALYNPDTPPLIIELLLELFPTSATMPVPGTLNYPLHVAAGTTSYHPQPFEIQNNTSALQLTLMAYKSAVSLKASGRLPLHIAVSRGKPWKEISCLVEEDPSTLCVKDPQSGLVPFQFMATLFSASIETREQSVRFSRMAVKQTRYVRWHELSPKERGSILLSIQRNNRLEVLTCIYKLLRKEPAALQKCLTNYTYKPSAYKAPSRKSALGIASSLEGVLEADRKGLLRLSEQMSTPDTANGKRRPPLMPQKTKPDIPRKPGPSLASFLTVSTGTSMRSLSSRPSGSLQDSRNSFQDSVSSKLFDSGSKLSFDDSMMSSMGASASSVSLLTPRISRDSSARWTSPNSNHSHSKSPSRIKKRAGRPPVSKPPFQDDESSEASASITLKSSSASC